MSPEGIRNEAREFARAYSVSSLLIEENFHFKVPDYQREYAWAETQVEDLWSDFLDFWANRDSDDDYLLGQVIASPVGSSKKSFYIVDGQQRFTTLFLLFAAARDFASAGIGGKVSKELSEFQELCRGFLFTLASGKPSPRLGVATGGQKAFLNLISGETWTPDSTDQSAQNIKDNYAFFVGKFEEAFTKPSKQFLDFMEMVSQNIILIFITLPNDEQALDFFERTNDRGLPLNQADLMKNLLFSKVKPKEYTNISILWANSVKRLRDIELVRLKSMDFALKALLSEKTGESFPRKKVFREWREKLKDGLGAEEFLAEIDEVTQHISQIAVQRDSDPVSSATTGSRYLNSIQQWTVTSASRRKSQAIQEALAEVVEARTLLSAVTRERSQDFERVISPWAQAIAQLPDNIDSDVRSKVLDASKSALVDLRATLAGLPANLNSLTYEKPADRKRIKLILALVSREMGKTIKHDSSDFPLSTFLGKTYDLEHIEPKSRVGSVKFNEENRYLIHSLGNLTLWYKSDNRSKGDVEPARKMSQYAKSSVLLTQALCPIDMLSGDEGYDSEWNKLGVGTENKLETWSVSDIQDRQELLSSWLVQYFSRTLID